MIVRLGTVQMTPAQEAAWFAGLPWWVKPFGLATEGIQWLVESNPLYTQRVATATAPGLPVGYDPTTGTVSALNTAGQTAPIDYASAVAESLPAASILAPVDTFASDLSEGIPAWLWIALALVALFFLFGGKRR